MSIQEPDRYEEEQILRIPIGNTTDRCYVVSGFADFTTGTDPYGVPQGHLSGTSHDEEWWATYQLYIPAGPEFAEIKDVSPIAGIAGFSFRDSDEVDSQGIELENCRWDTVSSEEHPTLERVRLKVKLRLCGGVYSHVTKISYHFVVIGVQNSIVG